MPQVQPSEDKRQKKKKKKKEKKGKKKKKKDCRIGSIMFPQGNVCIRVPEMTHSNMTSGEGVGWIGRCK